MATPDRRDSTGDGRAVDDLVAILRTLATGAVSAGGAGLHALSGGTEAAVSTFVRSRVARAVDRAGQRPSRSLHETLAAPAGSNITRRIGRSGAARVARRVGPLARRSPAALALRFGPAVYDVATTAIREIDAVAAALVAHAHEHRRDPDVDRIHTATVQVLAGDAVEPGGEPDHGGLARRWAKRVGAQIVPFGLADRGPDTDALARTIQAVDPAALGPARRRRRP